MEKYLKIHWSIRVILGIIIFVPVVTLLAIIFIFIYRDNLLYFSSMFLPDISSTILLTIIGISSMISMLIIGIIYAIYQYKRWAMIVLFIFIWFPLAICIIGSGAFILFVLLYGLIASGFPSLNELSYNWWIILIEIFILTLAGIFIKGTIQYIRLYRNIIKDSTLIPEKLQDTKPRFLIIFVTSIVLFSTIGYSLIVLHTPIVPLEIPEGYFKREDFNINNPTYTNQKICKEFETEIRKYEEGKWLDTKKGNNISTNTGVILGRKMITSRADIDMVLANQVNLDSYNSIREYLDKNDLKELEKNLYDGQKLQSTMRSNLNLYIQENPDQWKEDLDILRSDLTDVSVLHLQKITEELPNEYRCNIRNDNNITDEFYPSLSINLQVSRLFKYAIQLAVLEQNTDKAIDILKSFHKFNTKLFGSQDIGLVGGMIGVAILRNEFGVIESLIGDSTPEQIEKIQEIYQIPYDMKKNQLNAWKGEYYMFEHALIGRNKSIKDLSIPYIFNPEDMINRANTLFYVGVIADLKDDTVMKQKIHENQIVNINSFYAYEMSFIQESITKNMIWSDNWDLSGLGASYSIYNPIGRSILMEVIPSLTAYQSRYRNTSMYQDYIRYDLLGIEKNNN